MVNKAPVSPHPLIWFLKALGNLTLFGVSVGIGGTAGIAIAMWQPSWIWNPFAPRTVTNQRFTLAADVLFESSKSTIRSQGYQLLDRVAAQLPMVTGKTVRIAGHLDVSGGAKIGDLNLSYQRAVAVRNYLMRLRGEQTYHWIAIGYGSAGPIVGTSPNQDGDRGTNRRIEITVAN